MRINKCARVVTLLATLCALSACGQTPSGSDGATIAFLMPESETLRYDAKDRPAFIAKVKDICPDCNVIYGNADGDPAKQQQQAEAALTNGAAVLVLDPADSASAAVIARRAKAAGVPVIAYDRLIENAPVDYYVSFDNEKVGELQGQAIVDVLSGARGSVWGALTGAVVIGSIANGMDLLSFSSSVKFMVTGVVLLVAVVLDAISRSRAGFGYAR